MSDKQTPNRRTGTVFMMLGHVCMLGSLIMLFASKQAPQQGELIKGMVFAGVVCYVIGKYLEKKS
jgi:hypothetical protein